MSTDNPYELPPICTIYLPGQKLPPGTYVGPDPITYAGRDIDDFDDSPELPWRFRDRLRWFRVTWRERLADWIDSKRFHLQYRLQRLIWGHPPPFVRRRRR